MVAEGQLLWTPRPEFAEDSNLARYQRWLKATRGIDLPDYDALWRWSVTDSDAFWRSIWDHYDVHHDGTFTHALDRSDMLGVRWFEGARVNYVEHMLRHCANAFPDETAFHHLSETRALAQMSWQELGRQVRVLATQLRDMGVVPGDRVVSYMPNVPETAVAMMATAAIGAIWSSAAIEFGTRTVVDRFAQIAPKVLFAADGYRFGGKDFNREVDVRRIVTELPTLERVVWLGYLRPDAPLPDLPSAISWMRLMDRADVPAAGFAFERVAHDHALWVVYSSGTTGLPKPIVHTHVGVLLEHLKLMHLHINLRPGAVMFFYTTTGWMMWNLLLAALMTGSAIVLYDGNPAYPSADFLWKLAADTGSTSFGASPTFVQMMEKAGLKPGETHDMSKLESVVVSGAPSTPETFDWFYRCVKRDLWVTSQSGGTEILPIIGGCRPLVGRPNRFVLCR